MRPCGQTFIGDTEGFPMNILGIETSCDETSVAIVQDGTTVLSNVVYSQIKEHEDFGGVVPEIASRSHVTKLLPVFHKAMLDAKLDPKDIDVIAVAQRPGLMGALITGVTFAKSLSYAWNKPFVGVNHIYGHLMASFLDDAQSPSFPIMALIASGGHTTLIHMNDPSDYHIQGKTIDDAAGEALDKGAKMLGLGFPGGPALEKAALGGDPLRVSFPVAIADRLDFSFSGVKNALRTYLEKNKELDEQHHKDVCASYQEAIMQTLTDKLHMAVQQCASKSIVICGGVAANEVLREKLHQRFEKDNLFVTPKAYCTDNAAMIAAAGYTVYQTQGPSDLDMIPQSHGGLTF